MVYNTYINKEQNKKIYNIYYLFNACYLDESKDVGTVLRRRINAYQ